MTPGDDVRKIGTGDRSDQGTPDSRRGPGRRGPGPVLEPERRRVHAAPDPPAGRSGNELDRINRLRMLGFSSAGALLGFVLGLFLSLSFRTAPGAAFYPFVGAVLGWAAIWAVTSVIVGGSGMLAGTIYMPGGGGGRRREYSLAESLVARGRYEDAVTAFELAVAEHPDDPVPYLRIARVSRDHLDAPERAARWFKRGRDESEMSDGQRRIVTRELIELYRRVGEPTRAAPELARLAELFPDTREGRWAREELAEVKKMIADERE